MVCNFSDIFDNIKNKWASGLNLSAFDIITSKISVCNVEGVKVFSKAENAPTHARKMAEHWGKPMLWNFIRVSVPIARYISATLNIG